MKITKQVIFDRVASWLLVQGKKSWTKGGVNCAYRGEEGRMCAIGCLIKSEFYTDVMEGTGLAGFSPQNRLKESLQSEDPEFELDPVTLGFCRSLQSVHDTTPAGFWKRELELLANRYDLSTAVLSEASAKAREETAAKLRKEAGI